MYIKIIFNGGDVPGNIITVYMKEYLRNLFMIKIPRGMKVDTV